MIEFVSLSWMLHNKKIFLGFIRMNGEIREYDLLCKFTLQIIENCIKLLGFFLFALIKKMKKHRKDHIYERVQSDFGVNVFRHYYYCSGLLLENLKRKLKIRHGQECRILVRFDHIVVEESEGKIICLFVG